LATRPRGGEFPRAFGAAMKPHDKWPGVSIIVNKSRRAQDGPQQTLTLFHGRAAQIIAQFGVPGQNDPVSHNVRTILR
jgi:hypothetical protein